MLTHFAKAIAYSRDMRDDVHQALMPWDDILAIWDQAPDEPGPEMESVLRRSYQFLARHFASGASWQLAQRPRPDWK